MNVQTITLDGRRYVIIEEDEYKKLNSQFSAAKEEPALPSPNSQGNYPAAKSLTKLNLDDSQLLGYEEKRFYNSILGLKRLFR